MQVQQEIATLKNLKTGMKVNKNVISNKLLMQQHKLSKRYSDQKVTTCQLLKRRFIYNKHLYHTEFKVCRRKRMEN